MLQTWRCAYSFSWRNKSIQKVDLAKVTQITHCSSVQFSYLVVSDSLRPHGLQHNRLPCPSPTPNACSNSCSSSWWCHLPISSSVIPFPSCLQSFSASGSFPMNQFFASKDKIIDQSIGASASTSVLPVNIQDWIPLGLTGLISLQARQGQTQDCLITEPRQLCSTGMPLLTTMLYCIGFVFKGNTSRYGLTAKIHSNNIITFSQAYLVFMTC